MICFLLALILHASPDGVLRYVFFLDRTFPTSADTQYTLQVTRPLLRIGS